MRLHVIPFVLFLLLDLCANCFAQATDSEILKAAASHQEAGESFFRAGRFDLARVEFNAAYELSKHPDLLFNLGMTYEREGDKKLALAYFERYLSQNPGDAATAAKVELLRASQAETVTAAQAPPKSEARFKPRRLLGVSLAAIGGATLIAAIVLGVMTLNDQGTLVGGSLTYSQAVSVADAATQKRSAAIALGVLGGLTIGVSLPLIALPSR